MSPMPTKPGLAIGIFPSEEGYVVLEPMFRTKLLPESCPFG